VSFHTFYLPDAHPAVVQPMLDWALTAPGALVVSQNDPASRRVPASRWATRVSAQWFAALDPDPAVAGRYVAEGTGRDPGRDGGTVDAALRDGVNGLTAAGRRVVIDEARTGPIDTAAVLARACPLLRAPDRVGIYLVAGPAVSYGDRMAPLVGAALEAGVGLLSEIYPNAWLAERSGDVEGYVRQAFSGPNGERLPHLLERRAQVRSSSPVRVIVGVSDGLRTRPGSPGERARLDYMAFVGLVIAEAVRGYPEVARAGLGTWKWQTSGPAASIVGPGSEPAAWPGCWCGRPTIFLKLTEFLDVLLTCGGSWHG